MAKSVSVKVARGSQSNGKPKPSGANGHKSPAAGADGRDGKGKQSEQHRLHHPEGKKTWFTGFATATARLSGKPATFLIACVLILAWAVTGPFFNYSDTWQLVVNTSTTIITFLMVFLIQNTQNRDSLAFQIKLAELIIAMRGAENRMATVEDMCDADLESLHEEYRKCADDTLEKLKKRRGALGG